MKNGIQLTNPDEQLFRQVHPSWIQAGRPTSQAFKPTPKDQGMLSVSRGSKTTASAAFELHTRANGMLSIGVWGFRVVDCADIALNVYEDPVLAPVPDPAHSVVDFSPYGEKDSRAKAQLLKARAEPLYVQKADEPDGSQRPLGS